MSPQIQLEAVRRRARRLLVTRRLGQAVAAAVGVALALGVLDYLLRLPGWLRLGIAVAVAAGAAWWVATRLGRAWRFAPTLPELALRAEARFPAMRGVLAGGLELATTGGALAAASAARAREAAAGTPFHELVEPRPARRAAGLGLAAALAGAGLVALAPAAAATAAARWLHPLGDAAWPLRHAVSLAPLPAVLPASQELALRAAVEGPSAAGLRVWAEARFEEAGSGRAIARTRTLMPAVEAGAGVEAASAGGPVPFAARVPLPPEVAAALASGSAAGVVASVRVVAGDGASEPQERPVRERPRPASAAATVSPPAWAAGLVPEAAVALDAEAERLGRVAALAGSGVELAIGFSRPLPAGTLRGAAPALAGLPAGGVVEPRPASADPADGLLARFPLAADARVTLRLRDGDADAPATLQDAVPRTLDLVARPDDPPRARVSGPAADGSVLATAVLPVAAAGSDDLALLGLSLEAAAERGGAADTPRVLAESASVGRELEAAGEIDLAAFGVGPGDAVVLHAVARAPGPGGVVETRSAPRTLRIVDASTLLAEVRREVAAVRREARGLAAEQARLREAEDAEPASAASRQARLARAVEAARARLDAVADRLRANRADEPGLVATLEAAGERLAQAAEAAGAAGEAMADPAAAAPEQREAEAELQAAADLLDAGGDAAALRLDARALADAQRALRAEAARLLPETAGRSPEQLTPEQREAVEALAREQEALAERAQELLDKLREASADPGSTDAERAASAAMAEAAQAAAQAGLTAAMDGAAEAAAENQLAGAGEAQDAALEALGRVLEAFEGQERRRRELLQARLAGLVERVERLRADAAAEEAKLDAGPTAAALVALAEPLSSVWERSLALSGDAGAERETEPAVAPLDRAAAAQARGIAGLRAATAVPARAAQREGIAGLDEALATLKRLAEAQRAEDEAEREARLRGLYAALADRQDALADAVDPLAGEPAPDRRARATLRGFAAPQEAMAGEADALEQRAGEGAIFAAVHADVEDAMTRAAARLRAGDALGSVSADQRSAAAGLRAMADALVPPPPKNDFAEGGGGAGGGGGGAPPPDVPSAAQVKLLRGMQARLLADASALRAPGAAPADAATGRDLAARQRRLLDLGRALAEQVRQQNPGPAGSADPPAADGDTP
ncbi:hypothetical protein [Phycisphaera mikurensis]|uniref:DUF4175 family protein n=1 Tax=Phycisphaera mikurensis (strain NBRC 102666 / KCTC 22515 / FYK2301M01) TaxID=1142394 RepID=I0IBQ7_PHYMF|nr:hypothetical protein [Phycisphaera mikurensis]MBB6443391.1 hypothetical protein [Phycisphaera mikurensis]BAM02695.1 hypothetical protein PSMK_05360 [Phycisphaera mikurensis NBRC 102666]